jgi:hypothetical protein
MARAYRGPYARQSTVSVPYATAAVWGTGIDPIHSFYGEGPPLRVIGRDGAIGSSPVANAGARDRSYQSPMDGNQVDPPQDLLWGYPDGVDYSPDSFGAGADAPISDEDTSFATYQYMASRPAWNVPAQQDPIRSYADTMAPWGTPGIRVMGMVRAGSHRFRRNPREDLPGQSDVYQPISAEPVNSNPTETVSEGWINKGTSFIPDANPSADEQIFVQTSMRQRYTVRDNRRAMKRGTDDERSTIASRVMPMIEKVYSTGERLYDMFPYQQDEIRRPFRNRTAGVGPAEWMQANEYNVITPVIRTPPPDPAQGVPEVQYPGDYGYQEEDSMYYAG